MPGRTRSAQPTARPWNIEIAITALGALGERAHVRVAGRLVAGDDEQADGIHVVALVVGRGGPRVGDAAAVRGRGHVERAAPVLPGEAELLGELRDGGAAAAAGAGPDQHRLLAARDVVRARDDGRAVPARLAHPEVDDRRALGERHVAEHGDDLRLADRGERQAVRVERARDLLGQHRLVRAGALAHELRERIRLLDRLGAGERDDDAALRRAQAAARPRRARRPRRRARSRGAGCAGSDRRCGRSSAGA